MRSLPHFGKRRPATYRLAALVAPALPLPCTFSSAPEVQSPFVGDWATEEDASITIRPDTIVQHQRDGESTTLDKSACRGLFRFAYGTKSRDALVDLISRQPDLRQRLSTLLVEQSYPVAELDCDRGDQ